MNKLLPWLALLLTGAAGFVVYDTVCAVVALYHPLPYWDMWDFVAELEAFEKGEYEFQRLWSQHNEHRILFPRLFYFVDGLFFSCRSAFLIVCTLVLQLLHVYVLFLVVSSSGMVNRSRQWFIAALLTLTLFSALQINNFIWGFQLQFILIYVAVTSSVLCLVKHKSTQGRGWLVATVVAAFVANYSMVSGILVWPLLFVLSLHMRIPMRSLLVVTAAALLFGGLYVFGYKTPPGHSSPMDNLAEPLDVLWYACSFLGSPLSYIGRPAIEILGGLGLLLFSVVAGLTLRRGRAAGPAELGVVYLLAFLVGTAFVTAIGRSHLEPQAILASRYTTPTLVFWGALLSVAVVRSAQGSTWVRWSSLVLVAAWTISVVFSQEDGVHRFRDRPATQSLAAMALLANVRDEAVLLKSHGVPVRHTLSRADFVRRQRLSVFEEGRHLLIGKPVADHFVVAEGPDAVGYFDGVYAVPGDSSGRLVNGWSWNPVAQDAYERVVLFDDQSRIVGLADRSVRRPDIVKSHPEMKERIGWNGYVRVLEPGKAGTVTAAVLEPDGKTLRRLANSRSLVGLRTSPLESLGELLPCDVEMSGGWSKDGQFKPSAKPPAKGKVYGSWSGKDANKGELRLALKVPAGTALGIPLLTGPVTKGLSIRVVNADTGAEIVDWRTPTPSGQWFVWRIDLPESASPQRLTIVARDEGEGWGQWFALATPRQILSDN